MLTSLDGKLDGSWLQNAACNSARKVYDSLCKKYECSAVLCGTATMRRKYAKGVAGKLPCADTEYSKSDYLAVPACGNYLFALDPRGFLGWKGGYIHSPDHPSAHVVEILTERASNKYLAYLRRLGISYIFVGADEIDCSILLHKLKSIFGIERLMIIGGGVTNWTFAKENLIDELSIVVAPVADGNGKDASIFQDIENRRKSSSMKLCQAEVLEKDVLWVTYKKDDNRRTSR